MRRSTQHGRMPSFDAREADSVLRWFIGSIILAAVIAKVVSWMGGM